MTRFVEPTEAVYCVVHPAATAKVALGVGGPGDPGYARSGQFLCERRL